KIHFLPNIKTSHWNFIKTHSIIVFISVIFYLRFLKNKQLVSKEKEFSQLIKEHQGLIIKVSRLYTNKLEDDEDLFQEIVLQVWRSYDTFKGVSKICTWMYRVAL